MIVLLCQSLQGALAQVPQNGVSIGPFERGCVVYAREAAYISNVQRKLGGTLARPATPGDPYRLNLPGTTFHKASQLLNDMG